METYCQYKEELCCIPSASSAGSGLFFAYPSVPETSADAIKGAIELLRKDNTLNIGLIDWKDLPIEGNIIFCEICEAIRKSSCVVLNTTYTNFNILFEYGYSIGAGKAIWPLVEEGIAQENRIYSTIDTLTTIGYSKFTNSRSLYHKMLRKEPWKRTSRFGFDLPASLGKDATRDSISSLYLQSKFDNEPSLRISEALAKITTNVIRDDPREVSYRPLSWYLNAIKKSYAVIIHLGSDRMEGYALHSAKCALVAGVSLASGRRLLILGEDISSPPIDYREIMRSYSSATQAEKILTDFISPIDNIIFDFRKYIVYDLGLPKRTGDVKDNILAAIDLGDYIAEYEEQSLSKYFVETPQFLTALEPKFKVFVGRKGSGKSANFYMIMDTLFREKRNVVVNIKPKEWQFGELVDFIKHEWDKLNKGYLLQSWWKFMIYSEVIKTCYEKIREKPVSATFSTCEDEIIKYVDRRTDISQLSFTSRLVNTVRSLVKDYGDLTEEIPVSEILHDKEIALMHRMLVNYIQEHRGRCTIVIDSLDANWDLGEDYKIMADILLSLIYSAGDTWRTCSRELSKLRIDTGISILIFLRNDVFDVVLGTAKEPDKIQYELILWDNIDKLLQIVNQRILHSLEEHDVDTLNWVDILESGIPPDNMRAFVESNLIWRPRDFIFFFERAFFYARSRVAKCLELQDFKDAMTEYSEHAFRSLCGESQPYIPKMEDLILGFAEAHSRLSLNDVQLKLKDAGIKRRDMRKTIDFLVQANFLGYRASKDSYRFPITPTEFAIMAKTVWNPKKKTKRAKIFIVHNAFHNALAIS
jgi:hypothetical protein